MSKEKGSLDNKAARDLEEVSLRSDGVEQGPGSPRQEGSRAQRMWVGGEVRVASRNDPWETSVPFPFLALQSKPLLVRAQPFCLEPFSLP